jgi:hypothetical protein
MFMKFQHLTRWLLPGDPSLSEKGENPSDVLTASFVASAVPSAFTAYMIIFCSSGQTGVVRAGTTVIYDRNNNTVMFATIRFRVFCPPACCLGT